MAKKSCKCDPHELCEECPEWIFTLADLIMCMMGLFVILWVLKPGDQAQKTGGGSEELYRMIGAIREAFSYEPDPTSSDPVDIVMLADKFSRMQPVLNGPGEKGKSRNNTPGAEGTDPEVTAIRPGKLAAVGGKLNFPKGDATLTLDAKMALDDIVKIIRGHRNIVMIKGHTSLDDFGDAATAQQKMDLSLRRAQAVSDYLTTKGVAPDTLRVLGCSTFEPVQQRAYTSDLLAMNRRAEVEVTPNLVEEFQDRSKSSPATLTTPPQAPAER
jgi:outer membrane protein OmpA-like peptidoglycan-associated protein